jgi:hypothetical protein
LPSLHPVLLLVSTSACNSMGQTPVWMISCCLVDQDNLLLRQAFKS